MSAVLSVTDLQVAWGDRAAVRGVSFEIGQGEALGLLGESGSGKSTAARGALRLLPPPARVTGGEARLLGVDVLRAAPATLRRLWGAQVGLVPQAAQSSLHPSLTLAAHLRETLAAHGVADEGRIGRALAAAQLDVGLLGRRPRELSGGQRQRAALALALLLDPPLLVLDEPTSALDVLVARELLDLLLRRRSEAGTAMLVVTHDLPVLQHLADRAAVVHEGRIVEIGDVEAVLTRPRHPHTRALVAAAPPPLDAPARAPRPPSDAPLATSGCRFAPRCPIAGAACRMEPVLRTLTSSHAVACHGVEA